jgi:hypothetical protein
MTRRRLLWTLAPAGTLAAHGMAYSPFTGDHANEDAVHAYLPLVAAVVIPCAIAALLWTIWRRGRSLQLPSVRSLVAVQLGTFAVQEVVERLAARASLGDLLQHPAVRWGAAAQLLTAAGVLLVTRVLRHAIWAFLDIAHRADLILCTLPSACVAAARDLLVAAEIAARPCCRAPPVVFV